MDSKGKFSLILTPQALPGHCNGCGKSNDRCGFIDTGFDAEYYGAVIFCSECVMDMASKFGFIKPEVADNLIKRVDECEQKIAIQRQSIVGLEDMVNGLQNILDSRTAYNDFVRNQSVDVATTSGETASNDQENNRSELSSDNDSRIIERESEVGQLIEQQRTDGISDDPGKLVSLAELGL